MANFPSNDVLNFALNVEKVTTAKVQKIHKCIKVNLFSFVIFFVLQGKLLIGIATAKPVDLPMKAFVMLYIVYHLTRNMKNDSLYLQKPNLILNVDGCIAVCLVDLLRHCGSFTR